MTFITGITLFFFYAVVKFLLQALALKLAVGVVKPYEVENQYMTALTVAGGVALVGLVTGFIPWIGWLVYLVAWCAIMMTTYKLTLMRSLVVALMQLMIASGLTLLAKWVGLLDAGSSYLF